MLCGVCVCVFSILFYHRVRFCEAIAGSSHSHTRIHPIPFLRAHSHIIMFLCRSGAWSMCMCILIPHFACTTLSASILLSHIHLQKKRGLSKNVTQHTRILRHHAPRLNVRARQ